MNFQIQQTKINGVCLITTERVSDDRGYFKESYRNDFFEKNGLPTFWAQDNLSMSWAGVLRGMHIQKNGPQGKLVSALHGTVFDAWVDLRKESPTFKQWDSVVLTSQKDISVYIPPGLAHGFMCLSQIGVVHYKCSTYYDKESDGGVRFDDKEIGIKWPYDGSFIPEMSGKDMNLPTLREYLESLG